MPGLYGFTGNANVAVSNTPGLYINSGASPILTNAQQLLTLLSNNGTVIFQLDPATGYSTVEAFANVSGGTGGYVSLIGDITGNGAVGYPITTTLSVTGVTPGTYGSNSNIPIITVDAKGRVDSISVGNVATYLPGDPTIAGIQSNIVILQSQVYTNANTAAYVTAWAPGYLPGYLSSYTGNINAGAVNTGTLTTTGNAVVGGQLIVNGNIIYNNTVVNTFTSSQLIANATTPSTNSNTGAIISYGGVGIQGDVYVNGLIHSNSTVTGSGFFFSNGQPYGGTYGNANVAIYLPTDSTITGIQTNVQTLNANVGAYEIYANNAIASLYTNANANTAAYLLGNTIQGNIRANIVTIGPYGNNAFAERPYSGALEIRGGNGGSLGYGANLSIQPMNGHDTYGYTYANISAVEVSTASGLPQPIGSLSQINLKGNILVPNSLFAGPGAFINNVGFYNSLNKPAAMFEGPVYFNFYNNNTNNSKVQINSSLSVLGSSSNLSVSSSANINLTGPGNMYTTSLTGGGNIYLGTGTYIIGDGSKLTGITTTYSNANVASYLTTATINTTGNLQASNVLTNNYLFANGVNILTTVAGIYSNTNVAAYLTTATINTTGNISSGNITATNHYGTNYLYANGQSILTGIGGTYTNANVAAYLPTDPTIYGIQANIGAFEIYSNANASSQATSINTINANIGAFETYANLTFSTGGGSSYGNSNVAAYLTGNITVGNIKSTSGYFWANGVNYSSTVPGTYTNSNVTNLLSGGTYGGDINAPTGVVTAAAINSTGQVTAATYLQATNGLYSTGAITEAYSDGIVIDYTSGNGRISVGTADAVTFYAGGPGNTPTAVLYPTGNLVLPGSLTMTNGVFWANGTAYSSGSGSSYGNTQVAAYLPTDPTIYGIQANIGAFETYANVTFGTGSFSGNLAGNTLTDSINQRIFANASPQSPQYFRGGSYFGNASASAYSGPISYTGSNIVTSSGISAIQVQANLTMQSAYGVTTRTVYGQAVLAQLSGITANTMNNNDRIRALSGVAEVYPQGLTWGTMSSASQNALTIGGTNGIVNAVGTGNVSALVGMIGVAFVAPDQGSLNAQYVTGSFNQIGYNLSNATNRGASNITYARLFAGAINSGGQANLAITNSIGLHTYPYWHANVSATTNRWAVLNEDASSLIQSAGNIVANTGAYFLGDGSKLTNVATSTQLQTLDANVGAFETYANATFQTTATAYGNTQVAAYLPLYSGNTGATLTTGNQPYITRLDGVTSIGTGGSATISLNGYGTTLGIQTSQITTQTDFTTHQGNITITGDNVNKGHLIVGNTARAATYYTTTGYFWANGTAYSSGGSTYGNTQVAAYLPTDPTIYGIQANIGAYETWANTAITNAYFNGNLAGNILYDSINLRTFSNAYPLSTPNNTIPGNNFSNYYRYTPVYTNGAVQQPPLPAATADGSTIVNNSGQIVGFAQSANIGLQTGYGLSGTNRSTIGAGFLTSVTPITANSMSVNDRVRALSALLDINLSSSWATPAQMGTGSQASTQLTALNGLVNISGGTGNVAVSVGGAYGTFIVPSAYSVANVQYATGLIAVNALQNTNGTSGKANVVYARGISPSFSGWSANLVMQNAIMMHTYSGWAGTNVGAGSTTGAYKAYAILNEDASTVIQTNGNIVISASTGTPKSGFMQFGVYPNASLPAVGVAGQVVAISDPANTAVNPAGSLAYWDTTNNRWSYVATNTVVP